jgi:alpha-beta hydrolase superfamily lysophospholipase
MDNWSHSPLESPTGASVRLYSILAEGDVRGVVQINHGLGEHAARYQRFAEALSKSGYHVYAHDHRGHGATTAGDAPIGVFSNKDGWAKMIDDVHAVNQHIHAQHPDLPIIIFGHSMGSIVAFNYTLRHGDTVNAMVCWNAGFPTGALPVVGSIILKIERMFKGSDVPSGITRKLTFDAWNAEFKPNRTGFDWLSRDEAEVDKYVADPLCGFPISVGMWLDVMAGVTFAADDGNLSRFRKDMPVHLQAGADDPCSERGKGVEEINQRLGKAGMSDVSYNLLENTRHESLNEINRDQTTIDFIAWLDQRFGQRSG